jgi:hypothetical protein
MLRLIFSVQSASQQSCVSLCGSTMSAPMQPEAPVAQGPPALLSTVMHQVIEETYKGLRLLREKFGHACLIWLLGTLVALKMAPQSVS